MADRPLKLRELRRILRRYGVEEDPSRGKGSHTVFFKSVEGRLESFPVPTNKRDVKVCYVAACRRRFKLTAADGVTDEDFYRRA